MDDSERAAIENVCLRVSLLPAIGDLSLNGLSRFTRHFIVLLTLIKRDINSNGRISTYMPAWLPPATGLRIYLSY